MDVTTTPVIRRYRLGDPVLVPGFAALTMLLVVLGLGGAVGWLAGRGAPAARPEPVIVEKGCPAPATTPASAPPAPPTALPVVPKPEPEIDPDPPARPARLRATRIARAALASGDGWEPARM